MFGCCFTQAAPPFGGVFYSNLFTFAALKNLILYSLLAFLVLPFATKSLLVFRYFVQFNYYAQVLCKNQDKPELNCNGKCALMKELTLEREAQEMPAIPQSVLQYELSAFTLPASEIVVFKCESESRLFQDILHSYAFKWMNSIFNPPELN